MSQKNLNSLEINMYIGKKISEARKEFGITQQALADYLGISRIAMSYYESGKNRIAIPQLAILAKALGKRIEYFIGNLFDDFRTRKKTRIETYNIDENISFELEMSMRNFLRLRGCTNNEINKISNLLLAKLEEEINRSMDE